MANKRNMEKMLDSRYTLLSDTASWLVKCINDKVAELDNLKNKLENNWDEQLQNDFETKCKELESLNLKMNFEQKEIEKFEILCEQLQSRDEQKLIKDLSRKITRPLIKSHKPKKDNNK